MSDYNSIMSEQFWACSDILSGHFKNLISGTCKSLCYCVLSLLVVGPCSSCNQQDGYVCVDCSIEQRQLYYYCTKCSLHQHQIRYDHKHDLSNVHTSRTLQLLSVLCIETSHYVCFTRITGSSGKDEWVFFDSMAERQGKDMMYVLKFYSI